MPISGFLAASKIGWPSIFYVFGALSIIWSTIFLFCGADSPSSHRTISQEEKEYIEDSLRTKETKTDEEAKKVNLYKCIINYNDNNIFK